MVGNKTPETAEFEELSGEERWRLARRSDLSDAMGIVLTIPEHGQDTQGNWRYGLRPMYGWANTEISDQFESEMRVLVSDSASSLVLRGILTSEQVASIRPHPYSVGPAAQEWPKVFFDFYQDARPFLNDGASILAWGLFLRDVIKAIWTWASVKEREHSEYRDAENVIFSGHSAMPGVVFTRPAILALCFADLVERYSITGDVQLEVFPRSFTSYATADHPGGQETYLVRAESGLQCYYYLVKGTGEVIEHYVVVDSKLTLLPLPSFIDGSLPSLAQDREPLPEQQLRISDRH